MLKYIENLLNMVAKHFRKDASKMLIWTGVAGWALSSAAQIGAILVNKKIPDEQKSFLVPQEMADAAVNIGLFFLVTQMTKRIVSKMFSTGKFAPTSVRKYLNERKDLYEKKVGKIDFDLDEVLKKDSTFPQKEYYGCKNFGTTLATITAGVASSNLLTPIIRNNMASHAQKKYIDYKKNTPYPTNTSYGMKV